jgi:hypothetical protein
MSAPDLNTQELQLLIRQFERGHVVLFAGAGFSIGAKNRLGQHPPLAPELCKALATDCNWTYDNEELAVVYDQARKYLGTKNLNERLYTYYINCNPAPWHQTLTQIHWFRIYTTNIDDVIEAAYQTNTPKQQLEPIICPTDYQEHDHWFETLQCVHLHGSVIDAAKGFTFTYEDFATQTAAPSPWYQALIEDMQANTIIFVGTRLNDPPFYHYLTLRSKRAKGITEVRPKAFLIAPGLTPIRKRQFEEQGMVVLDATAEEFFAPVVAEVARRIPNRLDLLRNRYPHQIATLNAGLLDTQSEFLRDFEFITAEPPTTPRATYRTAFFDGAEPTWDDIRHNVDAPRDITNEFLTTIKTEQYGINALVLLGHAGSGKTTILRRIAYELARDGRTVYYLRAPHRIQKRPLINLLTAIGDRHLYFCMDDANLHLDILEEVAREFHQKNITFVLADRPHAILSHLPRLGALKPALRDIPLLNRPDSEAIIDKLDEFGRLGDLQGKPRTEQVHEFLRRSNKQLLVAMKEATSGRGFDVILLSEFNSLQGRDAQLAYTIACLCFKHGVPVRKRHLIACLDGTDIDKINVFQYHLRDVVVPWKDNDDILSPRHRVIADQVAKETAPLDLKIDATIRFLSQVCADITPRNITKRTIEYRAYRGMINLDNMMQVFGENYDIISGIYRELKVYYDHDFLFWLQFGRAELHFDQFPEAETYLKASLAIRDTENFQAHHHMGVLYLKRATFDENPITALLDLHQGEEILRAQIKTRGHIDAYPFAALIQHKIRYLRRHNAANLTADLEELFALAKQGLQNHPYDQRMIEAHQEIFKEYLMRVVKSRPPDDTQEKLRFT